jgi:Ran GTPase-activating protein (RanGAP) involved in mRNA processing and transport
VAKPSGFNIQPILTDIREGKVTFVNLYEKRIGDEDASALAQALTSPTNLVTELNLYGNRIRDEGVKAIAGAMMDENNHLTELILSINQIGPGGATALGAALKHPNNKLMTLSLYGNEIGPKGTAGLAEGLIHESNKVTTLDLANNTIGVDGFRQIARVLRSENNKLITLKLSGNSAGPQGASAISEALNTPYCKVTKLDLSFNYCGAEGANALANAVSKDSCPVVQLKYTESSRLGPDENGSDIVESALLIKQQRQQQQPPATLDDGDKVPSRRAPPPPPLQLATEPSSSEPAFIETGPTVVPPQPENILPPGTEHDLSVPPEEQAVAERSQETFESSAQSKDESQVETPASTMIASTRETTSTAKTEAPETKLEESPMNSLQEKLPERFALPTFPEEIIQLSKDLHNFYSAAFPYSQRARTMLKVAEEEIGTLETRKEELSKRLQGYKDVRDAVEHKSRIQEEVKACTTQLSGKGTPKDESDKAIAAKRAQLRAKSCEIVQLLMSLLQYVDSMEEFIPAPAQELPELWQEFQALPKPASVAQVTKSQQAEFTQKASLIKMYNSYLNALTELFKLQLISPEDEPLLVMAKDTVMHHGKMILEHPEALLDDDFLNNVVSAKVQQALDAREALVKERDLLRGVEDWM